MTTVDLIQLQSQQHHITHIHAQPDVPARLVYQRILVNTYRTSDLCRPPGRARPPSAYIDRRVFALTRVVPASTSLVLDAAAATCRTVRTTLWLPAVLLAAVHAVLLIDMMKIVIVLGANRIFRQMMQPLNTAV